MENLNNHLIPEKPREELQVIQKREVLQGILLFLGLMIVLFVVGSYIDLKDIQKYIEGWGYFGPWVFIILKASTIIIAPIIGGPIYLIAGPLFGFWNAFYYSMIGDIIGSSIAFGLSRLYGRRIINLFFSKGLVNLMEKLLSKMGTWKGLLYARLLLFTLHDLISYAAGLTKIKFLTFILISTLTFIVPVALSIALGLAIIEKNIISVTIVIVIILFILGIIYDISRRKKRM